MPTPLSKKVVPGVEEVIEVQTTSIAYDDTLAARVKLHNVCGDVIASPDGDTLLHVVYFLIYTAAGRQLLQAHGPTQPDARAQLTAALRQQFPALCQDRIDLVIDAHFAADQYVAAGGDAAKQQAQRLYEQKVLAILGALHDDAMGHDFSLVW